MVGELHPGVLEGVWGAFELDLAKLLEVAREEVRYTDVVSFPPVHQDLAFAVPEEVSSAELVAAAREAAGEELRELRPFDVYRGEQVGEGRKSIAFAATFQSAERTLTDEDAAEAARADRRARCASGSAPSYEPRCRLDPLGQRDQHLALELGLLVEQLLERPVGDHEHPHRAWSR